VRLITLTLLLAGLSACSPPVMFSVSVDEEIRGGTLTLNGASAPLMRNVDGAHWAKWDGSDASGTIQIVFPDGATTACDVGYVTHGMTDVQTYVVADRVCSQVREE
jgi:hypothetical protein